MDTRYRMMTVRKRGPRPPFALAMDEATSSATSTGAMAFKALTNTSTTIRSTSELSDHFFRTEENLLILCKVRKKAGNGKKSLYL